MSQHTNFQKRDEAIRLREEERLPLKTIAARVGYSQATCCRWLKDHPLTLEESKKIRGDAARPGSIGRKQSPETIRKRVEKSREKIRANSIRRFGGSWIAAKENNQIRYISTKPCKKGHVERYVRSRLCVQCAFEKQRDPSRRFLKLCTAVRCRAKRKNLAFNITPEYIQEIWPKDDCCPILKQQFSYPLGEKKHRPMPLSPSIDRRRPEIGYVRGNVAIISNYANTLKSNCTDPEIFRRLADWIERKQSNT
jgi:hypothetical protein